jgi:hypothetical protein
MSGVDASPLGLYGQLQEGRYEKTAYDVKSVFSRRKILALGHAHAKPIRPKKGRHGRLRCKNNIRTGETHRSLHYKVRTQASKTLKALEKLVTGNCDLPCSNPTQGLWGREQAQPRLTTFHVSDRQREIESHDLQ